MLGQKVIVCFLLSERFCVKTPVIHDNRVDAQEDHFSGAASDHNDDFPTSSLMKEILSEFMDRLKSQDQVEHFSDRYYFIVIYLENC